MLRSLLAWVHKQRSRIKGQHMKLINEAGQAVYFNVVTKNGKEQYIIKAISGQKIPDRDRRPHSSRTFTQLAQAEKWLERNGYK